MDLPCSVKKCRGYLLVLATAPAPVRKALLKTAPKDLLKCLKEIAKNVLEKNIPATQKLKRKWKLLKKKDLKTLKVLAQPLSQTVVKWL